MCPLLLFTNLQTQSAHRSFVDFSIREAPCDLRSTKCVAYFDLSRYCTNNFLIWATTFHVYVEHTLWCNAQMYIDNYKAYRN